MVEKMKEQLTNQTRLPQQLNAISARLSEVDEVQRQCAERLEEHERILELLSWVMVPLVQKLYEPSLERIQHPDYKADSELRRLKRSL